VHTYPWLAIPLLVGLSIAFAGLFKHIQPMCYGLKPKKQQAVDATMWPVFLHLMIVLWLGLAIPEQLSQWFNNVTILITGSGVL